MIFVMLWSVKCFTVDWEAVSAIATLAAVMVALRPVWVDFISRRHKSRAVLAALIATTDQNLSWVREKRSGLENPKTSRKTAAEMIDRGFVSRWERDLLTVDTAAIPARSLQAYFDIRQQSDIFADRLRDLQRGPHSAFGSHFGTIEDELDRALAILRSESKCLN